MRGDLRTTLAQVVDPATTALLVIDVQKDFCRDENRRRMIPTVEQAIGAARAAGVLVVYVQNITLPDGLSDATADLSRRAKIGLRSGTTIEGTEGAEFVDAIAPRAGDPVVRKHRHSGFVNTTLDTLLRSNGIETIVVVGTATQGGVISTAYGGVGLNYFVVVVRDAVASWRSDLHDAALLLLENTVNEVVDAQSLAGAWNVALPPPGSAGAA